MIVVVIIGILAAIVLPRLIGQTDVARENAARVEMRSLMNALGYFKLTYSRLPTNAEGLKALVECPSGLDQASWPDGGFLDQAVVPLDPWKHPYVYTQPGEHGPFDIVCYGADGQPGGEGARRRHRVMEPEGPEVTRSPRSGFTLIELMMVVIVLGIIAAIAAPRVAAVMPRVGLQGAARQVADDVRAAQSYAIDLGRTVSVVYDLDEGTVSIAPVEGAPAPPAFDPLPDDVTIAQVASTVSGTVRVAVWPSGYVAPHTVELEGAGAGRMTVEFSGLGVEVR